MYNPTDTPKASYKLRVNPRNIYMISKCRHINQYACHTVNMEHLKRDKTYPSNQYPRPTRPISLTKPTHRVLRPSAKIGTPRSAGVGGPVLASATLVGFALGCGLTTRSAAGVGVLV